MPGEGVAGLVEDRALSRFGAPVTLWALVGVLVFAFAALGATMIRLELTGDARPSFYIGDGAEGRAEFAGVSTRSPDRVLIAGSGSNLPLTRRLVEAFMDTADRKDGRGELVVFESIGSTGGVKAVHDGAIDLGLISRALRPREEALELVTIPYARVAVVAAVHRSVPDRSLTSEELIAIYGGERRSWSDGARIVVLQREQGDSSHEAVGRVLPGFLTANERAYRESLWRVVYRDSAMQEALMSTPGAIGLFDLGAITSERLGRGLELMAIDGVRPSIARVADGGYRYFKDLSFVSAGPPTGLAADFVAFTASPKGQEIIRANGYAPLRGEAGAP